ncbi:MAG: alpha/beta fold hydrolase [Solirubrobacteraceae bacterium]
MSLSFQQQGSGAPLLLIHGTGGSWETWAPIIDLLIADREVFAIDLPGHGASPPLPQSTPPSIPALADVVAQWITEQKLERPHVAGNSLGGAIALELAKKNRVRSATVLSPVGFSSGWEFTYSTLSLRMTHIGARLINLVAPLILGNPVGRTIALSQSTGRPWRMQGDAAVRASRAMLHAPGFFDTIKAAKGYQFIGPAPLDIPLTIAWGKRDRILLPRQAKHAKQMLPQARFLSLPGCGHVPMADDPQLIATVLLENSGTPVTQRLTAVS